LKGGPKKPKKGTEDPTAGLPECPNTEDDDPTIKGASPVPYPRPGANCRTVDDGLVQLRRKHREPLSTPGPTKGDPTAGLPACPNTEDDDNTVKGAHPVAYPRPGANCVKTDD